MSTSKKTIKEYKCPVCDTWIDEQFVVLHYRSCHNLEHDSKFEDILNSWKQIDMYEEREKIVGMFG